MKRSESSLGALVLVVCGALRATVGAAPLDSVDSPLEPYDLVLRGGKIIDGSGNPWMFGDLAIRGDRIAAVGQVPQAPSRREIDARGLVVSPGFIDMHSHSDFLLLEDGNAESKIRQGVTTEVFGESSSGGPSNSLRPWCMTSARSDMRRISSISLETKRMATPSAASCSMSL